MKNNPRQFDIILVEDDKDHADIIEFYIKEACKYSTVKHLDDGEKTMLHLQRIEEYPSLAPDIIILDLKLPKYDGHDILQKIKSHPSLKRIPVIIFSTSNAYSDIEKALNNHANSYIVKPIEVHGFKEIIATLVGYWKLHESLSVKQEDKP